MKLPGTLPIWATIATAAAAMLQRPQAFALAALPFCVIEVVILVGHSMDPHANWPNYLGFTNTLICWTLLATNWHRALILDAKPTWRWGMREARYAVISFLACIAVLLPPLLVGTLVQVLAVPVLNLLEPLGVAASVPLSIVAGLAPLILIVLAVAKSIPIWLWLPSEAVGRNESYDSFSAMAHGDRVRLALVNGLALLGTISFVTIVRGTGLPESAAVLAALLGGSLQIGVLSLCYLHLSAKAPATTEQAA